MRNTLLAGACSLALLVSTSTPAFAQLMPPNAAGVSLGAVYFTVPDVEKHKKIWVDAFGAILFFPLGEMKGQLVFDVAVELAAMEERFEAEAKSVNPLCKHGG